MKDLDKVIIFINNKRNIIENILYKYCILKNYSNDLYKNIVEKFFNKINNKENDICDFALKLKKKLILIDEEERLLDLIIKYFKLNNIQKIVKIVKTKKIIKMNHSEPSISEDKTEKRKKEKHSESINLSDYSTSESYKNLNIFITKNDLINNFGNKVKHDKKPNKKLLDKKKNKKCDILKGIIDNNFENDFENNLENNLESNISNNLDNNLENNLENNMDMNPYHNVKFLGKKIIRI